MNSNNKKLSSINTCASEDLQIYKVLYKFYKRKLRPIWVSPLTTGSQDCLLPISNLPFTSLNITHPNKGAKSFYCLSNFACTNVTEEGAEGKLLNAFPS